MYVIILAVSCFVAASAEVILFKNCSQTQGLTGLPTSVEISPCPTQPCIFKHGQTVNVKITFTAVDDSATLQATVFGIVFGIPVSFPLPNGDACLNSGLQCPIKKGQVYVYNSSFQVLATYPEITLVVMWKLVGSNDSNTCFTFPMAISDAIVG